MAEACLFSYCISENEIAISQLPVKRAFGKYRLLTDESTPFSYAANEDVECGLFGLAVNVLSGNNENIARDIAEKCKTLDDVIAYEKQLGGKYLLLVKIAEKYYLQGDATCSIPVFYNTDGAFICTSNCQYIINEKKYLVDSEYDRIRKSGDISQAMPYDITPWRQIKQLIPNHYLDMNRQEALRFVNARKKQKPISVAEATDAVLPMIEKLLAFYQHHYKIYCPITAGRDSRVVLSFLMKSKEPFSCYTIKHPEHNEHTPDLVVPAVLCEKANVEYRVVEDVTVSDALKTKMDDLLGEGNYSPRTLRIAETIRCYFGDGAILNGDIIGQVGKCSLHRDIPSVFASPSYFRCKLHNYSTGAKELLKKWIKGIKQSGEKINLFDLFSVESRMGRWAGQENLLYNTIGQVYLNIFNSRSIICIWSSVPRRERKKSLLHTALIDKTQKSLLNTPFKNEKSIVVRFSKATGLTYLLSSYAKFYIEKRKFEKGKRQ